MAYLLDTGVLLRLFDRSDSQHAAIRLAVRRLARRGERMVTALQNIAEFWNVSTRPTTARGGYGHPIARVQRRVAIIERFCDILVESDASYAEWKALVTGLGLIGVAVHDARLVAVMKSQGISHVLTLNPADFQRFSGLLVESPSDIQ